MQAMVLEAIGQPLALRSIELPEPRPGEVVVDILACGVCRTDLHIIDGDLPAVALPLVPGHQIVGTVRITAGGRFQKGARIGIPWLGFACGACRFCNTGRENLCDAPQFTGYSRNGGFAEQVIANEEFCLPVPSGRDPAHTAPLLCAGLIGYRALRMAGPGRRLGLYGFGASAHIVAQIAQHEGRETYAFTRPEDLAAQAFARKLGVTWAGGSDVEGPVTLDAAIIFAPVGSLVPRALRAVDKGGRVVCAGIHMSNIPSMPYSLLWEERSLVSVANLTRKDGLEFMSLLEELPVETVIETFALEQANDALDRLRSGRLSGAAVLSAE